MDQFAITLAASNGEALPRHVAMQRGDSVVLSTDKEVAIATGCVVDVNTHYVTVATDRNVRNWERNVDVHPSIKI